MQENELLVINGVKLDNWASANGISVEAYNSLLNTGIIKTSNPGGGLGNSEVISLSEDELVLLKK